MPPELWWAPSRTVPNGTLTASTGTATTTLGYAGQYTDAESGLIYLRARYYDPATAQALCTKGAAASAP